MRSTPALPRRAAAAAALFLLAGSAAGCGTSSASASAATPSPVCESVASLKQSVDHLRDLQISENGVAAMRDQLRQVKADLDQVVAQTKGSSQGSVTALQQDWAAIRSAAQAVKDNPSAQTLSAVKPPLQALATDVQQLADQVKAGCS